MKKFSIVRYIRNDDTYQRVEFRALDEKGKYIFGTMVAVTRFRLKLDIKNSSWELWELNWSCSGTKTYENALPYVESINTAMEFMKKEYHP